MSDSSLASFLGEVARPGLMSIPDLDTVSLVVPPPSLGHLSVPPVVTVFTLSDAWNWISFFFLALQVSPCDPVCRCVDLFPPGWNGRFHLWRYSGMLLGRLRRPVVPPRGMRLVSGLPGLLGSCFWSFLPRSGSGCGCFRWPPVLFILRLPGFLGDCGFADVDGGFGSWGCVEVRLGAFFLLGFQPAACFPNGWLVQQLGSLPPIFSLAFSFGVVVTPWFLVGVLQRFFPPGCLDVRF